MSEYVFPFSGLSELNSLFSEEILPYDHYNSLTSLQNVYQSDHFYNQIDAVDSQIVYENTINNCSYYDVNSYKNLLGTDKLSLLCHNINSLPKNFDNFFSNFCDNTCKPKLLAFCETKLHPNIENLYSIPGYSSLFNSRNTHSGGLALFIESSIKFVVVNEFNFMYDFIETLCVEITVENETYFLCLLYRRPGSDFDQFLVNYYEILRKFGNKKCLIFGDFNLNLLNYESSNIIETFVNTNFENSFFSLINKPTRVTNQSATVIDHIWCNFVNGSIITSGILLTDASDHFAPFMQINLNNEINNLTSHTYRNWDNLTDDSFREKLISELDIDLNNDNFNIDNALDIIVLSITNTIDAICPMKISNSNPNKNKSSPWITPEIKQLIKNKNRLYSKYCKKPITYGNQYKASRNYLANKIKISKKNYYLNLLNSCKNDCKKTWNVLNGLLNRKSKNTNNYSKMFNGVEMTSNVQDITNIFNNYFTNAPTQIANSLPSQHNFNFRSYLSGNYPQSLFIRSITPLHIENIVVS